MRWKTKRLSGVAVSLLVVACGGMDPVVAPEQTEWTTRAGTTSMRCEGRGPVPVILLAGGSDPGSTWNGIVAELGPDVLTCRFDRPGVGASDALGEPVTPRAVADVLADTLEAAELADGALLVGHSVGGLTVRVYGADRSASLSGALFLDPSVPDPEDTLLAGELASLGWDSEATFRQGMAVTAWSDDVPLTVLSHDPEKAVADGTWTAAEQERWTQGQVEYGALTPSGTQRDVAGSEHYVYRTHPDEVVAAIRALLP